MTATYYRRFLTPEQRFWSQVDPCRTDGEILWIGHIDSDGYGIFWFKGRSVKAHRWLYESEVAVIGKAMTLDHVKARGCTHRSCVRTNHLEPVTIRENILRGNPGKALNAYHRAKTHCKKGHPFDTANTYLYKGGRYCRECHRIRSRKH